jgi:YHS domain-containing protein
MIRFVVYLFLTVLLISVIRSIAGILGKAISGASQAGPSGRRPAAEPRKAGELKRDPVCGIYISTATSVKRNVGGEVVHFCSVQCSEKYERRGDRRGSNPRPPT